MNMTSLKGFWNTQMVISGLEKQMGKLAASTRMVFETTE